MDNIKIFKVKQSVTDLAKSDNLNLILDKYNGVYAPHRLGSFKFYSAYASEHLDTDQRGYRVIHLKKEGGYTLVHYQMEDADAIAKPDKEFIKEQVCREFILDDSELSEKSRKKLKYPAKAVRFIKDPYEFLSIVLKDVIKTDITPEQILTDETVMDYIKFKSVGHSESEWEHQNYMSNYFDMEDVATLFPKNKEY